MWKPAILSIVAVTAVLAFPVPSIAVVSRGNQTEHLRSMQKEGFAVRHRSTSIRRSIRTLAVVAVAALSVPLGLGSASAGQLPHRIPLAAGSQPEGLRSATTGSSTRGRWRTARSGSETWMAAMCGNSYQEVRAVSPWGTRLAVDSWGGRWRHRHGMVFRRSGSLVRTYKFEPGGFVNDVVVTQRAAFFTDSVEPSLYRVPIDDEGLPSGQEGVEARRLRGDLIFEDGFNANGIDRFRVQRCSCSSKRTLASCSRSGLWAHSRDRSRRTPVSYGDGVLVIGHVAFVVQNFPNKVAKVRLSEDCRPVGS